MSKHYKQNKNHKPQQNRHPKVDVLPFMAEIIARSEEDYIKIPVSEYMGLVANTTLLETVKRCIEADKYDRHSDLRVILSMKPKEEAQ